MSNQQSKQDDFEVWLIEMDAALERFLPTVEKKMNAKLDYSIDSLKILENWIKSNYQTIDEIKKETAHLDGCARYVGEVIRKQLNGKWTIDLEDDKNVFYRLPVVEGRGYHDCPLRLITTSIVRAKDDFIFGNVKKKEARNSV